MLKVANAVFFVLAATSAIVCAMVAVLWALLDHSWLGAMCWSGSALISMLCARYYYKELKHLQTIGVDASRHHGGHHSS